MRDRGLFIPVDVENIQNPEEQTRVFLMCRLWSTINSKFIEFAREHFREIPSEPEQNLEVFFDCYARQLRRFKNSRKLPSRTSDPPVNYAISRRLIVYDALLGFWQRFGALYELRQLDSYRFCDALVQQTLQAGMLLERMDRAIEGDFNHAEHHLHFVEHRKRGADKRHAENRAMKADVFTWLDANNDAFKSMDAAAEGIAGKVVPIAFRTARDWVGEWKKLRSASTP